MYSFFASKLLVPSFYCQFMKKPSWDTLGNVGQFVGGILAPVLVILAWYSIDKQLKSAAVAEQSNWTLELDKVFIDHSDLRPYFEENRPISPDDPDFPKAVAIAELLMDTIDSMFETGYFPLKPGWEKWMKDVFANSPILRRHLREKSGWYDRLYRKFQEWEKEQKGRTGAVPE
jgi:hypothetical protein